MTRRFGNSDKITEAKEVLTLVRGGFGSLQGSATINWGTPTIGTIEPDDGDSAGVSINPARSDHQHAIVCDAPSADSVKVTGSTEGSSTSFARADHTHNLDESITPTWTGATHTFDDGSGDSPAIQMVGGSNNDTAKIYLADDITATDSDLVIQLCDAGGDSVLAIHDSSPAAVLELDSNGNIEMQNDGAWIGRGAASARTVYNASGNAVSLYSAADLVLYSDAGSTQVGLWDGATGNITLVDDAWIGLGAASTRMVFDETSGNSLDLYSGMDLRLFSDTGSTQVGLWDGATGNIVLDDGSGDSPELQFIGGTNDDTIKIFLDDDGAAPGGSDLNVQLADAAGASNFEIWSSTPAAVLKVDSDGNVELVNDGAWLGFVSAGPKLTFDTTNDDITLTGGDLHLNDGSADRLLLRVSGDVSNTEADIYANEQMGLAADTNVYVFIDADNDSTSNKFAVAKDAENVAGATDLFSIDETPLVLLNESANGKMTIGLTINQGGNDDEILALMSTDVGHGITDFADTETFGRFKKSEALAGGLTIDGLKDADGVGGHALRLLGSLGEAADTTKSTSGYGIISLEGKVKSGTSVTTPGADANLVTMRSNNTTRFIFDQEGEMHSDAVIGSGNDWDDWDDLTLAADLSRLPRAKWNEMMRYRAEDFERAGLLTLSIGEDGKPHAFIKHKAMLQFYACCFREVGQRLARYERALGMLGFDLALLEG